MKSKFTYMLLEHSGKRFKEIDQQQQRIESYNFAIRKE